MASGLDPVVQRELHDRLRGFASCGGTELFSSHMLSEVEHVADRVGILLGVLLVPGLLFGLAAITLQRRDIRV